MAGYELERPPLFAAALSAAKRVFDPTGILNPGILLPPQPAAPK
jgi:alkyldihydroxyacetonephosphate synthase